MPRAHGVRLPVTEEQRAEGVAHCPLGGGAPFHLARSAGDGHDDAVGVVGLGVLLDPPGNLHVHPEVAESCNQKMSDVTEGNVGCLSHSISDVTEGVVSLPQPQYQ